MSWKITLHQPDQAPEIHELEWPRDAWNAVREIVQTLEAQGFAAGELETIRYGSAWVQHLTAGDTWARVEVNAPDPPR